MNWSNINRLVYHGVTLASLSIGTAASAHDAGAQPVPVATSRNMESAWPANLAAGDKVAIEALVKDQDRAWNAGDAHGFTMNGLEAITHTSPLGSLDIGRDHWEAHTAGVLSGAGKGSVMRSEIEYVSALTPDVVIVDSRRSIRGIKGVPVEVLAPDGAVHSRNKQVLVRKGAKWHIASIQGVFVKALFLPKSALR